MRMKEMNRSLTNMLIMFCLVLALTACGEVGDIDMETPVPEVPSQTEKPRPLLDFQAAPGDVVVFTLDAAAFQMLLNEPSFDILIEESRLITAYRISNTSSETIDGESIFPDYWRESLESGIFRIGAWPIYTEFIDFMNDPENFVRILLEHGIYEEILRVSIITHPNNNPVLGPTPPPGSNIPKMCIWIQTDAGNYFLEHHAFLSGDIHDTNFLNRSRFHDLAGFRQENQ